MHPFFTIITFFYIIFFPNQTLFLEGLRKARKAKIRTEKAKECFDAFYGVNRSKISKSKSKAFFATV